MSDTSRRNRGAAWTFATLALSACVLLGAAATLAQAAPHAKTCAHINGCSASVNSIPIAATGGPAIPASHVRVAVATAPKSAAKARHTTGTLMTKADLQRGIRCGGYQFKVPTTFQFQLHATTSTSTSSPGGVFRTELFIVYEITERITNATADGAHFCLGADFAFKTLSGRPAPARRLPDGTRGHVGLLPPCPQPLPPLGRTTKPCLEPVTTVKDPISSTGVDVILNARIPVEVAAATVRGSGDSGGGDPWGGG
ncbi:MAG TPA: hypothetical protein VFH80_31870 [Solirubrobacteraceae bacterium]|nr:hypothetical protein [Solirubrobacteraceae bacterium]